jgi:hypothetical protein
VPFWKKRATVLHRTALYYIALYYTVLHCIELKQSRTTSAWLLVEVITTVIRSLLVRVLQDLVGMSESVGVSESDGGGGWKSAGVWELE